MRMHNLNSSQPASFPDSTTSPPQLSPFEQLPSEIRSHIIEYLLPLDHNNAKTITIPLLSIEYPFCDSLHDHGTYPSRLSLRRFLKGIATTSHTIRSDALYILYSRPFVFQFSKLTIDAGIWGAQCKCYRDVDIDEERPMRFLPGLDFTSATFKVHITPSEELGTWQAIEHQLECFCWGLQWRMGNQRLRALTLEIVEPNLYPRPMAPWHLPSPPEPEVGTPNRIVGLLQFFPVNIRNVQRCDVMVPAWARADEGVRRAVEDTQVKVCTSWDCEEVGSEPVALRKVGTEEKELSWKSEYPWMKRCGEPWDDWYLMPNPRFDIDYDLRGAFWVFDEMKNVGDPEERFWMDLLDFDSEEMFKAWETGAKIDGVSKMPAIDKATLKG